MKPRVSLSSVDRVLADIDRIQKRVTERAYEIFRSRGGAVAGALDDWLQAERETVWRPAVELAEKDGSILLEAALAGVEAKDLEIEVTPDDVILRAKIDHRHGVEKGVVHLCEFRPGQLFRSVHLPTPIDPATAKAEYRNGLLRVTAALAVKQPSRRLDVQAA
jgi:HSP20 family protein